MFRWSQATNNQPPVPQGGDPSSRQAGTLTAPAEGNDEDVDEDLDEDVNGK